MGGSSVLGRAKAALRHALCATPRPKPCLQDAPQPAKAAHGHTSTPPPAAAPHQCCASCARERPGRGSAGSVPGPTTILLARGAAPPGRPRAVGNATRLPGAPRACLRDGPSGPPMLLCVRMSTPLCWVGGAAHWGGESGCVRLRRGAARVQREGIQELALWFSLRGLVGREECTPCCARAQARGDGRGVTRLKRRGGHWQTATAQQEYRTVEWREVMRSWKFSRRYARTHMLQ